MDPPPPYSQTREIQGVHTTRESPLLRWHPKITPSRLFVLLSTVVLGTLKAVFTYRGESNISTTLEWITGVIFSLLIFVLGDWESKGIYPRYFEWFFTFDCADLIWRALRLFSVPRPIYHTEEFNTRLTTATSTFVAVTGYRILVSIVVVILGSVKAILAYLGHNTTANTFDWALAVWSTSFLYYIGLYESNSVDLAPTFFVRDHSSPFFRSVRGVSTIVVLALAMYSCVKWVTFSLLAVKGSVRGFGDTIPSDLSSFILLRSLNVYMLCASVLSLSLSLSSIVILVMLTHWALRQEVPQFATFLFRRGMFANGYDRLLHWGSRVADGLFLLLEQPLQYSRQIGYSILRVIVHLFAIVALTSLIFLFAGIVMILGDQYEIHKGISGNLIGSIILQCLLTAYALALLWLLHYLFRSLIAPFRLSTRQIV